MMNAQASILSRSVRSAALLRRNAAAQTLQEVLQSYIDGSVLTHWLRFRETTGTTAANSGSLTSSTGAITTGGVTLGQAGLNGDTNEAYSFAGTTSKISMTHVSVFNNAIFTWAVFFGATNGDSGGGNGRRLVDRADVQLLSLRPDGSVEAKVNRVTTNSQVITAAGAMSYPVGKALLFVTYSEATGVKLYRVAGGARTALANATGLGVGVGTTSTTTSNFNIANTFAGTRGHIGKYDEFMRFGGVELSAAEMIAVGNALGA